jgi:hypothetical protein
MIPTTLAIAIFLVTQAPTTSPYSGEESRPIKSLSPEQIDSYLNGRGMGLARAAELNSYPGPMHVLELKDQLALSPKQLELAQAIFNEMKQTAVELGKQIVEREAALDRAFSQRAIDEKQLAQMLRELGGLQAELRRAHLVAHVRTRAILTERQVEKYDELRGYREES